MSKYHRHHHKKKQRVLIATKKADSRLVDRLTYGAAIVEPMITIPQVYQIFRDQSAAGISITAWIGYEILQIIWLWYGIVHKDKVIIVYSLLYGVIQMMVIIGAIMFGGKWI
jgi:uncharacterized protein with PQ loop repeat